MRPNGRFVIMSVHRLRLSALLQPDGVRKSRFPQASLNTARASEPIPCPVNESKISGVALTSGEIERCDHTCSRGLPLKARSGRLHRPANLGRRVAAQLMGRKFDQVIEGMGKSKNHRHPDAPSHEARQGRQGEHGNDRDA